MSAAQNTGPASYAQRAINVSVTLGTGTFGQSGQNTVLLKGLRVTAAITKATFPTLDTAEIRVYGLTPTQMQSCSTLGVSTYMVRQRNTVLLEAGDVVNGMSTVFTGYIFNAWQDFDEIPDTALNIIAGGGGDQAVLPVPPLSQPTSFDVATVLSGLANRMQWVFENAGVNVQLPPSYFPGTALQQCHDIARAANINLYADTSKSPVTLAIWPKLGTRGGQIPLISAGTGLVGYPKYASNGISFKTIFNPNIILGGNIQMQSTVGGAPMTIGPGQAVPAGTQSGGPNGLWNVTGPLVHDLSAQLPNGPWFTEVNATRVNPGYAQPPPTAPTVPAV